MDSRAIIHVVAGLIFVFVLIPVTIIPYWVIFKKAGFSPWFALLEVIPVVGIVVLFVVAFSQWKVTPTLKPWETNFPPQA
jgi:uncharacterized membrane protein YhaH (DUF805 family)